MASLWRVNLKLHKQDNVSQTAQENVFVLVFTLENIVAPPKTHICKRTIILKMNDFNKQDKAGLKKKKNFLQAH